MSAVKPLLRGFLVRQFKRDAVICTIVAFTTAMSYKTLICDPRKKAYADFYKTYDADADFERMRKLGLFQAASADDDD